MISLPPPVIPSSLLEKVKIVKDIGVTDISRSLGMFYRRLRFNVDCALFTKIY